MVKVLDLSQNLLHPTYYICGKLDHKIYACPHQTMAHVLFKNKVTTLIIEVELKEDALVNMVLEWQLKAKP